MGRTGITFDVATPADDAEVRRLYRDNPMRGAIRLSLEREPDASFAAGIEGDVHQTIVARRPGGGLCAVGTRSVRTAYVNGEPTRLGYLGGLRVDADRRNDPRLLLRGYAKLRELHEADGSVRLYLTSIVADNTAARRVLEAGLRGMPTYRFVGEFVTLVMPRRRGCSGPVSAGARSRLRRFGLRLEYGSDRRLPDVAQILRSNGSRRQFAPAWDDQQLRSPTVVRGLAATDFRLAVGDNRRPVACVALWDQRAFKQAVIRFYGPAVARLRPSWNLLARPFRQPALPPVGTPLNHGFVCPMAVDGVPWQVVVGLVEALHAPAATRRIDGLIAGFGADDPLLPVFRRAFGGRELRTRLYAVHWPDGRAAADALDGRPLGPEVAVL